MHAHTAEPRPRGSYPRLGFVLADAGVTAATESPVAVFAAYGFLCLREGRRVGGGWLTGWRVGTGALLREKAAALSSLQLKAIISLN